MTKQTPALISLADGKPAPGELVGVYSERDSVYGYARRATVKKYDSLLTTWRFDESQSIGFSPISHWFPLPVVKQ